MKQIPRLNKQELGILLELLEVLHASLDMKQALGAAYPLLQRLVPADHGALCVSRSDNPLLYDWTVAEMPEAFFQSYEEVAEHDFVRAAVAQNPNIVLRDHEMVANIQDIERHPLYVYSRSKHMPIEQIMAVMLSSDPSWHGGLTLYRDKRRPFSEHERDILQALAPFLSSAVTNCRRFGDLEHWSLFLETSLSMHRTSVLVFSPALKLVAGSPGIYELLDRCFDEDELGREGLPIALWAELEGRRKGLLPAEQRTWIPAKEIKLEKKTEKRGAGEGLVATIIPVVKNFATHWLVLFDEVPAEWRELLTPKEIDVAVRAALGWDSKLIAEDIGNSATTTKTHLFRIFNKLGLDNRGMLQARFRGR